jgi:glycerate dehydrogenase
VVLAIAPGRPVRFAVAGEVPLAEALARADAVSLHCPLTPATARVADAAFFAAMRPHAVLITTARGALVDEAAAMAALDAGEFRRLDTDVAAVEPPPPGSLSAALCRHPGVVATPHVAFATAASRGRLVDAAVASAVQWARGDAELENRVA